VHISLNKYYDLYVSLRQILQPRLPSPRWLGHLPSLTSPAHRSYSNFFVNAYPWTLNEKTDQAYQYNFTLLLKHQYQESSGYLTKYYTNIDEIFQQ
jgi:hypothetical protein